VSENEFHLNFIESSPKESMIWKGFKGSRGQGFEWNA